MKAESTAGPRLLAARLVFAHHAALVVFLGVGWALPWTWSLWTALAVYPTVLLSWWQFGNRCPLTVLEEGLRGARPAPDTRVEPLHFVQALGGRLLRRPLSRAVADAVSYGAVWGGFAITGLRLYFRC